MSQLNRRNAIKHLALGTITGPAGRSCLAAEPVLGTTKKPEVWPAVDVLVCGAISWSLEALLNSNGIRVIPFVCGDVADVVQAFRDDTLKDEQYAMPGCCRKRRCGR